MIRRRKREKRGKERGRNLEKVTDAGGEILLSYRVGRLGK